MTIFKKLFTILKTLPSHFQCLILAAVILALCTVLQVLGASLAFSVYLHALLLIVAAGLYYARGS